MAEAFSSGFMREDTISLSLPHAKFQELNKNDYAS